MEEVIRRLRVELAERADPSLALSGKRFFKEPVTCYGVKTATVREMSRRYFREIREHPRSTILALCGILWQSGYLEESFIACDWSYGLRDRFTPSELELFERWICDYVSNWASCDTLCNHTIGAYLEKYPAAVTVVSSWATSPNRWMRRAAAVSLIIPARKGMFLNDVFTIADLLLPDEDDLVRKGYGWMLKAASEAHRDEVFDYIMKRKDRMPRTALRYAIEKMPKHLRDDAMARQGQDAPSRARRRHTPLSASDPPRLTCEESHTSAPPPATRTMAAKRGS